MQWKTKERNRTGIRIEYEVMHFTRASTNLFILSNYRTIEQLSHVSLVYKMQRDTIWWYNSSRRKLHAIKASQKRREVSKVGSYSYNFIKLNVC